MDNVGDWLYLVFIIIAAVSSIFSSGKKKNQSKEILGQPDRNIIPSDRPLKKKAPRIEVVNKKEQKKKNVQVRSSQPVHAQPTPFLREDYVPNLYDKPLETITFTEVEEEPEEASTPVFELNNADDLKKAVIYAEILNRKY